ncbi:Hypothetical protein NTJ_13551 [Nesidiocoris tenuis]|uniref:Uncharacterized protein n=1 Tax=Nesidiocoris tenuis TaxID=355587 RepID=A0ABN7B8M3_9HEMI|nr:Hypothetical protein NTJ_13551 [Nesidiocoris tenuis]
MKRRDDRSATEWPSSIDRKGTRLSRQIPTRRGPRKVTKKADESTRNSGPAELWTVDDEHSTSRNLTGQQILKLCNDCQINGNYLGN